MATSVLNAWTRISASGLASAKVFASLASRPLNGRRSANATKLLGRLETIRQCELPNRPYTSGGHGDRQRIMPLEEGNPKRGKSRDRFELCRDGIFVEAALAAGVRAGDLRWDHAHNLIDTV